MWPLVLTSLVAGWVPVVPWLLALSGASLEGLLSLLFTTKSIWSISIVLVHSWGGPSLQRISELLQTVWALQERVWIMLNLVERWWWLSHCGYCSVWVVFLYIVIDRVPSASGFTMVSKKGMAPSSLLVSTVNWMTGSTLFMCCRNSYLWISLWMMHVSSTYLHQNLGIGAVLRAFCSKYSIYKLSTTGLDQETHSCTHNLFIELVLE